jgi:hypothetical protein
MYVYKRALRRHTYNLRSYVWRALCVSMYWTSRAYICVGRRARMFVIAHIADTRKISDRSYGAPCASVCVARR